jgi:hypothetical protein
MEDLKYITAKKQTLVNIKVQTNAGKKEVGEDVIPASTLTSFPRRRESRKKRMSFPRRRESTMSLA